MKVGSRGQEEDQHTSGAERLSTLGCSICEVDGEDWLPRKERGAGHRVASTFRPSGAGRGPCGSSAEVEAQAAVCIWDNRSASRWYLVLQCSPFPRRYPFQFLADCIHTSSLSSDNPTSLLSVLHLPISLLDQYLPANREPVFAFLLALLLEFWPGM